MISLCIVKPCSSGSSTKAVAVGGAVQKVNYQGLLWRDHHFSDKDTNHQTVNLDIQFPHGLYHSERTEHLMKSLPGPVTTDLRSQG